MSAEYSLMHSITIGAAGGSIAGITVYLFKYLHDKVSDCSDKRKVYKWMENEILTNELNNKHLSTKLIASYNNMTMDRTRYICSENTEIYLSAGPNDDLWGIYGISGRNRAQAYNK